jgi:hypothetical protein
MINVILWLKKHVIFIFRFQLEKLTELLNNKIIKQIYKNIKSAQRQLSKKK